ncbi:MAG: TRAP transporter large permease [Thermodesulfobacteriota bacterium]
MDQTMIGLVFAAIMVVCILIGIDVAVGLLATSFLGMWVIGDFSTACSLFGTTAFGTLAEYVLAAVPLFIMMGLLGNMSGATEDLFDSADILLGRLKGGLGIATVLANAVFAAITGASIVSAAVFSKVAYPQMRRLGYEKKFALGTVAGSSPLGMLIPPSLLFIYYGYLTTESIGRLFIAGILPGLVLTTIFCIGIWTMVNLKPELAGRTQDRKRAAISNRLSVVLKPWASVLLILITLGGIYAGVATPTEAGALGAFIALLIAWFRGRLTWTRLWGQLVDVASTVGSIFILIIGAQMFSRMLAYSNLPTALSRYVMGLSVQPYVIIILMIMMYLILGALIDSGSIILVTTPIVFPIITGLGYDPIWYGVVCVLSSEIGLITPPFGLSVFVVKSVLGEEVTVKEIFRGTFPFVIMMVVALIIICLFPGLSTWLPSRM